MAQGWHDLLFAHWSLDPAALRLLVPPQLELDLFEGRAWVGVVPFRMQDIRPRGLPALPWISAFAELNVRTYVKSRDPSDPKPGVCFFSLEAANPLAVRIARRFFLLPYFDASMSLIEHENTIHYQSKRTHRGAPQADFVGSYAPTGAVAPAIKGTLDHWLTERYCLYTVDGQGRVYRSEIHHQPWPLQPAAADLAVNSVTGAAGFRLPDERPICHFARRLDVLIWPLRRLRS